MQFSCPWYLTVCHTLFKLSSNVYNEMQPMRNRNLIEDGISYTIYLISIKRYQNFLYRVRVSCRHLYYYQNLKLEISFKMPSLLSSSNFYEIHWAFLALLLFFLHKVCKSGNAIAIKEMFFSCNCSWMSCKN